MNRCRKRSASARTLTIQRKTERAAKYSIIDRRRAGWKVGA